MEVLQWTKIELLLDSEIPLLCVYIYPKKMKSECWRDVCNPKFTATPFTIAKKQNKYAWTYEYIKKRQINFMDRCATFCQWSDAMFINVYIWK
jgi:hypothetical protein